MLTNYLKTTFRILLRNKGYSLINITGLALGLALFILIALYVQLEWSFDKFNANYDRIHRVELNYDGKGQMIALANNPLGPTLRKDYPEIVNFTRLIPMGGGQILSSKPDNKISENLGLWADEHLFEVFSFRLLRGNPSDALLKPFSIVLSKSYAKKYFPNEDPIGKTVNLNNQHDLQVTGVVEDCPQNSTIRYDFIVSLSTSNSTISPSYLEEWTRIGTYTFVLLSPNTSVESINEKIKDIIRKYENPQSPTGVYLKPLSQIHFYSNVIGELGLTGDIEKVQIFSAIGMFIILLASINYMNLSTARSVKRAKEVGLRKVIGANRASLIGQFLSESIMYSVVSLIIALGLVQLFLPEFCRVISREMNLNYFDNWSLSLIVAVIAIAVGFASGYYPAFLISRYQPVNTMKRVFSGGQKSGFIRKGLVIFQFVISTAMIIGALAIRQQIQFMKNSNMGYDKENILITDFRGPNNTLSKYETFKGALLQNTNIQNASISQFVPSFNGTHSVVMGWEGSQPGERLPVNMNRVDLNYLGAYGMQLKDGRNFFREEFRDTIAPCLINETAAKGFGWENPIGKRIEGAWRVIGVVKDFHFTSLRNLIEPMILLPLGENSPARRLRNQISIKIAAGKIDETVAFIKNKYGELAPGDNFEYRFFNEDFDQMYQEENRFSTMIGYFSVFAIFIACLGLFGLASFMSEQRTKEIGVRKVLGASEPNIVTLLSKEFTKWVLIANIIAWPIAYYVMNKWLQSFAYRIDLGLWIFILSGAIALIIALATVSYQAIRSATANPVDSLRYE